MSTLPDMLPRKRDKQSQTNRSRPRAPRAARLHIRSLERGGGSYDRMKPTISLVLSMIG